MDISLSTYSPLRILLVVFIYLINGLVYSQTLTQVYADRCTGATQVFQIAMTGTTTVVFYGQSQSFTAADVQSGVFRAWLEQTYAWWAALNPCSAAQAETTTAQQTAQQTTEAATTAASAAASTASTPPPPPTNETTSTPPATSTDSTSSSQSTDTSSSSTSESSQSETSDSSGGGESSEDTGGGESSESESESTEETSSEESNESESEESSEESSEEESSEEESEDSESGEDSEDEKEEKKEEKKKQLNPPILASNIMTNQMLDGSWSTAASFGMSQSSLTGQETYAANAMIWSNFRQFSLGFSKSKVRFWREKQTYSQVVNSLGKWRTTQGSDLKQNTIHHVGSISLNYMHIFGTNVITAGYSRVILGQHDNTWKGFAGGYAIMSSFIFLPESLLVSPSITLFGTKPVNFRGLPRWTFAPMVATSFTPIQVTYQQRHLKVGYNPFFTYIIGSNANFNLTKRFVANVGINTINNTSIDIPTTLAFTIGARFQF